MLALTLRRDPASQSHIRTGITGLAQPIVHLVNPLTDLFAGGEQHALQLYDLLKDQGDVRLWTEAAPDPRIHEYPIRRIRPSLLRFPRGGTIVFVGVFFPIGRWLRFSRPERIVLVYNTPSRDALHQRYRRFQQMFPGKVEIAYVSKLVERAAGLPGEVPYAPMNLARFEPNDDPAGHRQRPFTIGRLSRAVGPKHHPGDPALYRRLAKQGYRVRLMGVPAEMAAQLHDVAGVELLAQGTEDAADFLRSLDCLFYRTADDLVESWGRIVCEAMACALPVVCGRSGGYAELIDQGRNGFLFDDEEEALRDLEALRADRALRKGVGAAARRTIEAFYSPARAAAQRAFYLARK